MKTVAKLTHKYEIVTSQEPTCQTKVTLHNAI